MERKKKQEETLKLIKLFREREVLWNKNCFSYRRKDLKTKALEEIAAKCNLSADMVKKRIKALRSTYVLEKKKIDKRKNSGCEVYESTLFWFKEMAFLDSSIVMRKPIGNMERSKSSESISLDETLTSQPIDPFSHTSSTPKTKRKQEEDKNNQFDKALEKLITLREKNNDVYSAFADCIVMQLRSMPEKVAYRSMTDIQSLVFKRKFPEKKKILISRAQKRMELSPDIQDSSLPDSDDDVYIQY